MPLKLGIFGNCQADIIQQILLNHSPLTRQYDVVQITPVYLMTIDQRNEFVNKTAGTLDVLLYQRTGANYHPATSDNILANLKPEAKALQFVSIWMNAHFPDMAYLEPSPGIKKVHQPIAYDSRFIAAAYARGMSIANTIELFTSPNSINRSFLQDNYNKSISELKRRESECQIYCADMIARTASRERTFFVMNHPSIAVLYFVMQQFLGLIDIAPLPQSVLVERADALSNIKWPITASAAEHFQLPFRQNDLAIGKHVIPIDDFVRMYFDYYGANPSVIEANGKSLETWFSSAVS